MDKMTKWRLEGMGYALKAIEESSVDDFRKELAYRKNTGITALITPKELKQTRDLITTDALKVALIFSVYALRDEFGFGEERIKRFVKRYELKAQHFFEGLYSFEELRQMLEEETGFVIKFH